MSSAWRAERPIFQQVADQIAHQLLEGHFDDREFPAVSELARHFLVNPLVVARALARLASEGVVEMLPNEGYRLAAGAKSRLLRSERERVLDEEWPALQAKLKRLGLSTADLGGLSRWGREAAGAPGLAHDPDGTAPARSAGPASAGSP